MANFITSIKKAIEEKIVASKIEEYLNKFDEAKIENVTENYIEMFSDAGRLTSKLATQIITSTKPTIIKLAEKNSTQLIKLNTLITEIGDVISSMDTPENKAIVLNLMKEMRSAVDKCDIDSFEKSQNKVVDSIDDLIKPMIPKKQPRRYYVFNATKEYVSVNKAEWEATKKMQMKHNNCFYHYEQGNDFYEDVKH